MFLTLRLMPRLHLTIALAAALATGLAACTTTDAQTAAQDSVIAAERGALDRWGKGDPQGFLEVYAPEITYFDPMQERRLDGIEAMRELLLPLTGKIKVDRYEMIGTKVQQYGDVAVLSYNLNSHVTAPDGQPKVVRWNSTVVYVRQDRRWRSVHSHWSVHPAARGCRDTLKVSRARLPGRRRRVPAKAVRAYQEAVFWYFAGLSSRRQFATTVLFFVVVGCLFVAWALAVPIFEAPDEPAHWQYARYVHDHWKLPLYQPGFEEANSPPLYYLAIAPFATASKLPPIVVVDDGHGQGVSLAPPRVFANSDRDWTRYRPVLMARLWTALLSLITIGLVYRSAASLMPWSSALATAALAAFLPQFSFRAVTVSNDAAVMLFAAMLTLSCVQLLTRGFTWRRGVIAALALAAAYLSKILAIALAAPLALALLEARTADGGGATEVRAPVPMLARFLRLSVLLVALAIVLPWSLRNLMLYGDLTAQNAMRSAVSHIITDRSLFSVYFLWDFPLLLFASFIGLFGWANVVLPKWIYLIFVALALVAAAGVARGWYLRAIDGRVLRMLVLLIAAALAVVVYINLMFTQPQGRYMLQALPAVALFVALGLTHLPKPLGSQSLVVTAVALLVLNVWCLAGVIVPAYWPPLARTIAPGVRVVHPVSVHDLTIIRPSAAVAAGANLRFDVSGQDPSLLVPLDIDASTYDTIEVELAGRVPGVTGCERRDPVRDKHSRTRCPAASGAYMAGGWLTANRPRPDRAASALARCDHAHPRRSDRR